MRPLRPRLPVVRTLVRPLRRVARAVGIDTAVVVVHISRVDGDVHHRHRVRFVHQERPCRHIATHRHRIALRVCTDGRVLADHQRILPYRRCTRRLGAVKGIMNHPRAKRVNSHFNSRFYSLFHSVYLWLLRDKPIRMGRVLPSPRSRGKIVEPLPVDGTAHGSPEVSRLGTHAIHELPVLRQHHRLRTANLERHHQRLARHQHHPFVSLRCPLRLRRLH